MGTVNRIALREEFDAHQEQFRDLCRAGKVSSECEVLFNALLMLMRLMMTVFLEQTTRKTPVNAGLPSSRSGRTRRRSVPGPGAAVRKRPTGKPATPGWSAKRRYPR